MTSQSGVREVIRDVLCRGFDRSIDANAFIKARKEKYDEIWQIIETFDRNEYRKILNDEIRDAFYRLVDNKHTDADVNLLLMVEFGTKQWSDDSLNFMKSGEMCSNCCLYCYIQPIFNKNKQADVKGFYKKLMESGLQIIGTGTITGAARREHRPELVLDEKKINKTRGTRGKRKLFMSPTSHDTFPGIVKEVTSAWKRLLIAGHSLLIVSKPILECIKYICSELSDFKKNVSFRFTITTDKQDMMDVFEPLASSFDERLECLKYARDAGYETSASIEPFLTDPVTTVNRIQQWVTGEIWIGAMNSFPSEKIIGCQFTNREYSQIDRLKTSEYTFENVRRIVNELRGNPKIQWKESVIKMFLKKREL